MFRCLDDVASDADLTTLLAASTLQRLGEHEVAHPFDALVAALHGKVVTFTFACGEHLLRLLAVGDEAEGESMAGGRVTTACSAGGLLAVAGAQDGLLEGRG